MKHFTIAELCRSSMASAHRIKNEPSRLEAYNLEQLVEKILDPLREAYGKPIFVNSGYRCSELNKLVRGSATSQHLKGQAADITTGSRNENLKLFKLARELRLPFDQLINEKPDSYGRPQWLHVSYSERHRRQVLTIK